MARYPILAVALIFCLAAGASSQGYMGTVSTGTGILEPITVGKSTNSSSSIGAVSMQGNLSGNWALDLRGPESRHFDLQVLQKSDLIAGTGQTSSEEGHRAVTVAGYMSGDKPTIFISVIDTHQTFRVSLSHSGSSLSGRYDSLSWNAGRESGTATGQLKLTSPTYRATALGTGTNPSSTAGAYVGSLARKSS